MENTPLHPIERKVLASLTNGPKVFDALVSASGLLPDQVRRSLSWLSSKRLVTTTEVSSVELSVNGLPPELRFLERLREGGGEASVASLRDALREDRGFSAAMGRAVSSGWVEVKDGVTGQVVVLKDREAGKALEDLVSLLNKGANEAVIPQAQRGTVADLVKRGLVARKETKTVSITITPDGEEALRSAEDQGLERLTPEILSSIRATGVDVKLRPIDVSASAPVFHPGRRHPVKELIAEVREVYL